jgi:hypothetical protein
VSFCTTHRSAPLLLSSTRVVDHAAVDAGHGQRHADQQAQADAGEHELAPGMQDVAAGQADQAQGDLGEQPQLQSSGSPLVQSRPDPQAGGIDQLEHRLPGHHRRAGLGIARSHHAVGGRLQADIRPLLLRSLAVRILSGLVLPSTRQGGLGGGKLGIRRLLLLQLAIHHTLTDKPLVPQVNKASRLAGGQCLAALRIVHLGLRRHHCAPGAGRRRDCGNYPRIKFNRVHFRQQLTRFDAVTHIHQHASHPSGGSRPNEISAPRLDRTNTEQGRCHFSFRNLGHGHLDRRERPARRGHPAQGEQQRNAEDGKPDLPRRGKADFHGCSPIGGAAEIRAKIA